MPRSHPHPALALTAVVSLVVTACSSPSQPSGGVPIYQGPLPNERRIDHAMVESAVSQRRVLLVFGADWCSDSRAMAARLTQDPKLAPWIERHFFVTFIDVGPRNGPLWDAPVVQAYGRPFAERGIPALVVLEPDGQALTTRDNNPLKDSDHRHPGKLRRFLETWAPQR